MYRRWGVGFYRGRQSLGSTQSTQTTAYPDPDSNSYVDAHREPDGYTNGNGYVDAHREPDGYTNGNGYVYADANSFTRARCTRCQCGH
jgi:hypothetical protein